jgi:AmmeMemoRadiSam system protein B
MRRRAAVAGTWYPGQADQLASAVDGCLAEGRAAPHLEPLIAVIAPHAGMMYSGPVAGHAYAVMAGRDFDAVFLVGPSHFVAFDGVSIWPEGEFDTPLGALQVESALCAALLTRCAVATDLPAAHAREHSLEMQLPFLARILPTTPIVPVVMGLQERETVSALAEAMAAVAQGRRVALVASSDLSHFFDAETAARLDGRVADLIRGFDAEGLLAELEGYPEHEQGRYVMCGGGPAVAVMLAARLLGATEGRVLAQSHSGMVSGDNDRVVGYLAAAFGRPAAVA